MSTAPNDGRPTRVPGRWGHRVRVASTGAAVATIAVAGSLMLTSHQESSAATLVSAAVISAGVGSDSGSGHEMPGMDMPEMEHGAGPAPTPTSSGEMPGMEHGSESTPAPTHSEEMPGMDHEAPESGHGSNEMPGMDHGSGEAPESGHGSGDSSGHGDTEGRAEHRPLVPVLGTFGGAASAVLLTAGFMRRKDRADDAIKTAARAARRSQK